MLFSEGRRWVESGLSRKFMLGTVAGLITSSFVLLILFLTMYRAQLEAERGQIVGDINRLLQTSLENAMLKRDLDGLRDIVAKLGRQPGVVNVMILNTEGEVRFASNPEMLGRRYARDRNTGCMECHQDGEHEERTTIFLVNEQGREIVRGVNPVRNKVPCTGCHGDVRSHPFNGVLFVDYDAAPIRMQAWRTTLLLLGSGAVVLLIVVAGGWWFMRRFILLPVWQLREASRAIAEGRLDARVAILGHDELGELGQSFNHMAESLERNMREMEERDRFLQALVDTFPDGIRVIDGQYRVVLSNVAYRRQVGLGDKSDIGSPCYASSHQRNEPCPPTLVRCPLYEARKEDGPVKYLDRFVRADGQTFPVEIMAIPLRGCGGAMGQDLIVESVRDLEEKTQFSQEQRLADLGRLAAGVAHEIYNPLTALRMALNSMVNTADRSGVDISVFGNYLQIIDDQIDRCIDITKRLLKLSAAPGSPELVEVNKAIRETLSLLVWEAEAHGVSVVQSLASTELRVLATESEFRTIIFNLLQNAFHAMPEGGNLYVSTRRMDGKVELIVKDTGVGIAPQDLPYIFHPFFSRRADSVRGTGLGLAILRSIVDRYHGSVTAESKSGEGSRFSVLLSDADNDSEVLQ